MEIWIERVSSGVEERAEYVLAGATATAARSVIKEIGACVLRYQVIFSSC